MESCEKILRFTEKLTSEEFTNDDRTYDAVVRNLKIIGEATKHLPAELRRKYPDLPWSSMAKLRDRLIHGYFVVDHEIIWNVVKKELPLLKPKIEQILKELKC